jgi:hypothetical protein
MRSVPIITQGETDILIWPVWLGFDVGIGETPIDCGRFVMT